MQKTKQKNIGIFWQIAQNGTAVITGKTCTNDSTLEVDTFVTVNRLLDPFFVMHLCCFIFDWRKDLVTYREIDLIKVTIDVISHFDFYSKLNLIRVYQPFGVCV